MGRKKKAPVIPKIRSKNGWSTVPIEMLTINSGRPGKKYLIEGDAYTIIDLIDHPYNIHNIQAGLLRRRLDEPSPDLKSLFRPRRSKRTP